MSAGDFDPLNAEKEPTQAEMEALTQSDRDVLGVLDDEWTTIQQFECLVPLSRTKLVGRLKSLKRRGFVAYRPAWDSEFMPQWAITPKGDCVNHGLEILEYYASSNNHPSEWRVR